MNVARALPTETLLPGGAVLIAGARSGGSAAAQTSAELYVRGLRQKKKYPCPRWALVTGVRRSP